MKSGHPDQSWEPYATPEMEGQILGILRGIVEALRRDADMMRPSSLLGAALFFGYLSRRPGFESVEELAETCFGRVVESAHTLPAATLHGGYVGLGWHAAHLGALLGWDVEGLCAEIDNLVVKRLGQDPKDTDEYDLIGGPVGIAVYGFERESNPILAGVLRHLSMKAETMALAEGTGLAWRTRTAHLPEELHDGPPEGYFNLGLAHGNQGAMAVLAGIAQRGIESDRALEMIHQSANWLETVLQSPATGSIFARGVPLPPTTNRIAWCYGDLGASQALLQTARSTRDQRLERIALMAAELAAERPLAEAGVKDASLCHGSVGNAHIFNRLYHATQDVRFKAAAQTYMKMALVTYSEDVGFAGFTAWQPGRVGVMDREFLVGTTGIGLGLLAAIEKCDPAWDRLLLLSYAPSLSHQTSP